MVYFGTFLFTKKERYSCRSTKRPIPRPQAVSPHIPAALAATYPLRCFAPQWARFDNRHSTSAPDPTLAQRQRQRRKRYKRSPEPTTSPAAPIPRDQHRQICTCPPRAKGSLDRRSKRLSFPQFFLRRKKCGRRRPPPRQGKIDSPPGQRPPRKRKKRDGLRRLFLYLISCPCGSATPAPAPARISASCSPPPACRSGCPARSTSRTRTWPR